MRIRAFLSIEVPAKRLLRKTTPCPGVLVHPPTFHAPTEFRCTSAPLVHHPSYFRCTSTPLVHHPTYFRCTSRPLVHAKLHADVRARYSRSHRALFTAVCERIPRAETPRAMPSGHSTGRIIAACTRDPPASTHDARRHMSRERCSERETRDALGARTSSVAARPD